MSEVTRILCAIHDGDLLATEKLFPLVYDELRRMAAQRLAAEAPGHTLDATALVHEAYLRLVGPAGGQPWQTRGHFFTAAAEAIRRILIESARRKKRIRHGGERKRVNLVDVKAAAACPEDLLAMDEALEKLCAEDAAAGQLVKLRYYAGQSVEEAAATMGLSRAQAYRHWTYARAWLRVALADSGGDSAAV